MWEFITYYSWLVEGSFGEAVELESIEKIYSRKVSTAWVD